MDGGSFPGPPLVFLGGQVIEHAYPYATYSAKEGFDPSVVKVIYDGGDDSYFLDVRGILVAVFD